MKAAYFTFALLALSLSAQTVRADMLLTEVSAGWYFPFNTSGYTFRVAWDFYVSESAFWQTGDEWVGVPQPMTAAVTNSLSGWYHSFDFAVENPADANHGFYLGDITGLQSHVQLNAELLFTAGTFNTENGFSGLTVAPQITLPNGNSFIGTDWRFTRIEFTLDHAIAATDPHALDFTLRFYGVPEPSSACLMLCSLPLAHVILRPRGRRPSATSTRRRESAGFP